MQAKAPVFPAADPGPTQPTQGSVRHSADESAFTDLI